jgi:hypothetical protein
MADSHGSSMEQAHAGSATQRPKLPTIYSKRKRGILGTHQSLQSVRDAVGMVRGGDGANGAGELLKWGKVEEGAKRRGKRKRRGRRGVPALDGAGVGESEARASLAGPIYRPARPVSRR